MVIFKKFIKIFSDKRKIKIIKKQKFEIACKIQAELERMKPKYQKKYVTEFNKRAYRDIAYLESYLETLRRVNSKIDLIKKIPGRKK